MQDYYREYVIISSFAVSNVKINGDKATEQISATSSYPIKQDKDDTAFGTFQRKVADKSVFKRVVGAATGVVGAGGVTSGVAAVVGTLAGLVCAVAAPFVLVKMGALCICCHNRWCRFFR